MLITLRTYYWARVLQNKKKCLDRWTRFLLMYVPIAGRIFMRKKHLGGIMGMAMVELVLFGIYVHLHGKVFALSIRDKMERTKSCLFQNAVLLSAICFIYAYFGLVHYGVDITSGISFSLKFWILEKGFVNVWVFVFICMMGTMPLDREWKKVKCNSNC